MIKYLLNKTRFVVRYILIIFLAFVIIESVSRGFVMAVTKDFKVFLYGFNKDIKIDIFHLRKLDIKLTDLYLINQSMLKNKSNYKKQVITGEKIKIWTFGGSTSVGKTCGKNAVIAIVSSVKSVQPLSENKLPQHFAPCPSVSTINSDHWSRRNFRTTSSSQELNA